MSRRFQPAEGRGARQGRPLQGRTRFGPRVSVGFTYGYSWFPASRGGMQRIGNELVLARMGGRVTARTGHDTAGTAGILPAPARAGRPCHAATGTLPRQRAGCPRSQVDLGLVAACFPAVSTVELAVLGEVKRVLCLARSAILNERFHGHLREAPWTAVAAATVFLPPPLARWPHEPKAKAVAAATAVQRHPRRPRGSQPRRDLG